MLLEILSYFCILDQKCTRLYLARLITMGVSAFQIVTLVAVFEVFLIKKALPQHLPLAFQDATLFWIIIVTFGANYGGLFVFSLTIYPIFVDPLRKIPGPKERLPPV